MKKELRSLAAAFGLAASSILPTMATAETETSTPATEQADFADDDGEATITKYVQSVIACEIGAAAENPEALAGLVESGRSFKSDYEIGTDGKKHFYYFMESTWGEAWRYEEDLTKTPTGTDLALKKICQEHSPDERIAKEVQAVIFMTPGAEYIGDASKVTLVSVGDKENLGINLGIKKASIEIDSILGICGRSPDATTAFRNSGLILQREKGALRQFITLPDGTQTFRSVDEFTVGTKRGTTTMEAGSGDWGNAVKAILERDSAPQEIRAREIDGMSN